MKKWTEQELEQIRTEFPTTKTGDLAKRMERSVVSVARAAKRLGINKKPGHTWRDMRFTSESRPDRSRPIGSTRVNTLGYVEIKIADGMWRQLHRETWNKEYGEYPPRNMRICFKDGNRQNCDIVNLYLMSGEDLMLKNTMLNLPPELREVVRLKGAITFMINAREKKDEKRQ